MLYIKIRIFIVKLFFKKLVSVIKQGGLFLNTLRFLSIGAKIDRLYTQFCAPVCAQYQISQKGLDILLFLASNPACNTARDICEQRMIKSGIVSVTVEALICAGYLRREQDGADRRLQRLTLTPAGQAPAEAGRAALQAFATAAFSALTGAEKETYLRLGQKVVSSIEELSAAPFRHPAAPEDGTTKKEILP